MLVSEGLRSELSKQYGLDELEIMISSDLINALIYSSILLSIYYRPGIVLGSGM